METTQIPAVIETSPLPVATTRAHHEYSPSKMNYLDDCAAFIGRQGETTEAAEQGTFLHDLMEKMLQQVIQRRAATTLEQLAGWVVKSHELTEEEFDYLRFACKRCDIFISRKPSAIHTEITAVVKHEDGKVLNKGYLDVLFIFGRIGILIDFKFGWEPVRAASDNLQGINYAVGCFQQFRDLDRIGVEFIQPKLNWITSTVFERRDLFPLYRRLAEVVERVLFVKKNPQDAQRYMKPGHYCTYCALSGSCAVLANYRGKAVAKYEGLPMPVSFKGLELTKPEDVALARYWVDILETGIKEIKQRAMEIAEANGGAISCTLPNGEQVLYEVQERGADRSLGSAVEISETLKEFVSPQEILAAAELAIGKLEPIVKTAMVDLAKAQGRKLTKKAAWEQVESTLETHGLLTRPDYKIRFLKLRKQVKQIEDTKEQKS